MKNLSSMDVKYIKPFHIFLTGGAGLGKSYLMKNIFISVSKLLSFRGGDPEKPRILILAPTGLTAINIDETTILTALGINVGHTLYPFNDRQSGILRSKLSEIKFINIDEISMVLSVLFYQVHQRFLEF